MVAPTDGPHDPQTGLRLQILGPLRVWRDGVELSAGPRQQAFLLAVLLAREGRATSIAELLELIWGDEAPPTAVNVIHKYIGALRRLLEPTLRTRGTGSYLLRRGNGYLCAAGPGALDLIDFRQRVATARIQAEERRPDVALDLLLDALALWRGPAGDGIDHGGASRTIFETLNTEFCSAAVSAAELAVLVGRPTEVLPALRLAADMAPLHESVQASLITALGAAGQQAAALSLFREVRTRLAEDLGIEPGHALASAHQRVLNQDLPPMVDTAGVDRLTEYPLAPQANTPDGDLLTSRLVGRSDELTALRRALQRVHGGTSGLLLLEGEPGVGKTRLLEYFTSEESLQGAVAVWSHCLDGASPSMWLWVQIVDGVSARLAPEARTTLSAGELGVLLNAPGTTGQDRNSSDNTSRFRLFDDVVTLLAQVSARRPVVLVIDDLQWADAASLRLLAYMAARIPSGVLILGAMRGGVQPPNDELAKTLAAIIRVPGHRRMVLGPLNADEVAELIRRETGHVPSAAFTESIVARTDGNPLFVRELSRLLSAEGKFTQAAAARLEVPSTVRDVVIDLVSGLDAPVRELLQLAALIGREFDLGLLSRAGDMDVHACLGRLEAAESLGLLRPAPGNPFSQRFEHDLVREAIAAAAPPHRAMALHLRIADALQDDETVDDIGVERLAHHLWSAGPLADPTRTVTVLIRAGRRAARKTALESAERALRSAVHTAQTAGLVDLELAALAELITVVGMSSPHGVAAMELLERAESLAAGTGRQEEAAVMLYSRWMALAYSGQYGRSEAVARRLLEQGNASAITVIRALGLQAWGLQQAAVGNIGEAYRHLTEASHSLVIVPAPRENDVVWFAQQLSAVGLLAEMTAVHGDVAGARELLDRLEAMAGDDPYKITVWATHSVRAASVAGDAAWALTATAKGIAADPDLSFGFFGMYQRLARYWALAMNGEDPGRCADEVQRLITENLLEPPRSDIATWYGLLAEMHLVTGAWELAATALQRADEALERHGQRYSEGLILLMRARLLLAQNQPVAAVAAAAEAAREHSVVHEAHLFAQRAEDFLVGLGVEPGQRALRAVPPLPGSQRHREPGSADGDASAAE